jgi:HPt (histidine-containing phosphotransfer) domain-containing protein
MKTVDADVFRALQESAGADFVKELLATFVEEAPLTLAQLRRSWEAGSAVEFRRAAHSLKSNAQAFGAEELASRARDLETGGLPGDGAALQTLQAAYESAVAALKELARA